jgi:hypothetical protein
MSIQSENLLLTNQSQLILYDQANVGNVAIQADDTTQSYTLTLPNNGPVDGQYLAYSGSTNKLIWTQTNRFNDAQSLYVSKQGSDNNNGTEDYPFLTVKKAIIVSNEVKGPIRIYVGPGTYVENNDTPLNMTDAAFLEGASTTIIPSNLNQYLFQITSCNVQFISITMASQNGLGALNITGSTNITLSDVVISGFKTGINMVGNNTSTSTNNMIFNSSAVYNTNSVSTLVADKCVFQNNKLALYGSGCSYILTGCRIVSVSALASVGASITSVASITMQTCIWVGLANAINVVGQNTTANINQCYFYNNVDGVIGNNSNVMITQSVFTVSSGTSVQSISSANVACTLCIFDGKADTNIGIGGLCSCSTIKFRASVFRNLTIGFVSGNLLDSQSTVSLIDAAFFENNDKDIVQNGTTTLKIGYTSLDLYKVDINNSTNIEIIIRNASASNNGLIIGKFSNIETNIMNIVNSADPRSVLNLCYLPDVNGYPSMCWRNTQNTNFATSIIAKFDASHNVISESLDGIARLALVSDSTVFDASSETYRGWFIQKQPLTSNLDFIYTNKDPIAQQIIDSNTIMTLNGIDNTINIGRNQLLFDDIALYKYNSGLKLDGSLFLDSQIEYRVAGFDSSKRLVSTNASIFELNHLVGIRSNVQTQIDTKFNSSGGSLTGSLITIGGDTNNLAIGVGSNSCGLLSAAPNSLSLITSNTERMKFESDGQIKLFMTNGPLRILDNYVSSSLISTDDLQTRSVSNEKLTTCSSLNNPNYVVARDSSGNFAANMISILSDPIHDTDVATKAYVDKYSALGIQVHSSVHVVCTVNVACSELRYIDEYQLRDGNRILLIGQMNPNLNGIWTVRHNAWTRPNDFANNTLAKTCYVLITEGRSAGSSWVCITPAATIGIDIINFAKFSLPIKYTTGSNAGDGIGLYKASNLGALEFKSIDSGSNVLITNQDDKVVIDVLSTNVNTCDTIVSRDSNGNFAANQITANIIGRSSQNVLKTGDTMSGPLILMSSLEPALTFTNSQQSGISMYDRSLNLITNNLVRFKVNVDGNIYMPGLSDGIVHCAAGCLTSSLITSADIANNANIPDSKLDTIKTPGKVSNEATTASSSNIPNSIVQRDAFGNFTCSNVVGSFTGTLTGSASMNLALTGGVMQGDLDMGQNKIVNLKSLDIVDDYIKIKNTTIKTTNTVSTSYNIPDVSHNSNFVMESTTNGTNIIQSHETVSYITDVLLASAIASGIAVISSNVLNITIDAGYNIASNLGLAQFKVGTVFKVLVNNPTANNVRLIPGSGITLSAELIMANTSRLLYFIVMGNNNYSVY